MTKAESDALSVQCAVVNAAVSLVKWETQCVEETLFDTIEPELHLQAVKDLRQAVDALKEKTNDLQLLAFPKLKSVTLTKEEKP